MNEDSGARWSKETQAEKKGLFRWGCTYLFEDGIHDAEDGLNSGVDSDVIRGAAFQQEVVFLSVIAAEFDSARFLLRRHNLHEVDDGGDLDVVVGDRFLEGGVLARDF